MDLRYNKFIASSSLIYFKIPKEEYDIEKVTFSNKNVYYSSGYASFNELYKIINGQNEINTDTLLENNDIEIPNYEEVKSKGKDYYYIYIKSGELPNIFKDTISTEISKKVDFKSISEEFTGYMFIWPENCKLTLYVYMARKL